MIRKAIYPVFALILFVFTIPLPALAMDMGVQSTVRLSPISIEESLIGVRFDQSPFVFTPKAGFGIEDRDNRDTLKVFTFGCGIDYYLSEQNALKPYVGGDILIDYVDANDSDTSLSLIPHIGAEYFLNKNFSLGADVGLHMGFGDYYDSEFRFGTASSIHGTYYFNTAE
ncbi:MAG: hypothetical protein KGY56_09855 [Desulfobacterales bacterium]|nr:hypothetical protein [Desulfobacterales bacterium]